MRTLMLAALLFVTISAHAQTNTPSSKPQQATMEGMMRACQAVADELKAARELIERQRQELSAADETIKAERAKGTAATEKLDALQAQVNSQKAAIENQDRALLGYEKQVAGLQEQVTKLKGQRDRARKWAAGATILAVAAVAAGRK